MPTAPTKPCPRPHCGKPTRGSTYCAKHQREADAARPSATARGYTTEWATYSRTWLSRFPWCGQRRDGQLYAQHSHCVQLGLKVRAQVTDHIVALRDGGSLFLPTNHQSLCHSCNQRKVTR